jgi:hypothetical protein
VTAAGSPRGWWRDALPIVGGLQAVAVAVWLVPASVHIVRWSASSPTRTALLPPWSALAWLALAALALAAGLLLWARRAGASRLATAAAWPLWLAWAWAVPYLPWLPDRLPLLLLFAGPARWLVAALGLGLSVAAFPWVRHSVSARGLTAGRRVAFAVSLALYLFFAAQTARTLGPGGDEPHYLIIAHSLLADGDLRIENNHQQRDYASFFGGELRPDYMRRGQNGQIYSIHAPGLPLVLLPAYAAAGYAGSLVLLCLLSALAALAVFDLAAGLAGRGAAWITWAAASMTVPFIPHAWLLFPEAPGALLVAWGALWLWQPAERSTIAWIWRGAALGFLPWLHTKFVVFLAIFACAFALRLWRRPRSAVAFFAPIAVLSAAWLLSFYVIYGEFSPEAPYGDYPKLFVLMRNIPRGLLGLLFDQKFGLLVYSPVYLLGVAGCWLMLRREDTRFLGWVLLLSTAAFVGSTTRLYMWWVGSSAPARFLVPIVPLLAPMIAVAVARATGPVARALLGVWLAISLGVAAAGAGWPARLYLFSEPHGRSRIIETIQASAPLASALPTFTNEDWVSPMVGLVPWVAAAVLAAGSMLAVSRLRRLSSAAAALAGAGVFFALASLLTSRPPAEAREETARRGSLQLLSAYDGERLRGFDYQRMERVATPRLLELAAVTTTGLAPGTMSLPAGSYVARVWFAGGLSRSGEVTVSSSPRAVFGRAVGVLANPAIVPFDLPVDVGRLRVEVRDAALATGVVRTEIVAASVRPRSERHVGGVRAIEAVEGRPGAFIVYTDEFAYPEGGVFWTRGAGPTTVLLAAGGASRLVLTLHLGPRSGSVRVRVAGEEHVVHVAASDATELEADVPAERLLVPVTIETTGWFRPSDVDPSSRDERRLGAQVRVALR